MRQYQICCDSTTLFPFFSLHIYNFLLHRSRSFVVWTLYVIMILWVWVGSASMQLCKYRGRCNFSYISACVCAGFKWTTQTYYFAIDEQTFIAGALKRKWRKSLQLHISLSLSFKVAIREWPCEWTRTTKKIEWKRSTTFLVQFIELSMNKWLFWFLYVKLHQQKNLNQMLFPCIV